ncbi:MFS transporter [Aestuariivirga sp.]|jgi:D-galactonate transporter|uniref:MFS transporter n=1 Tax=Aestuariivirga sp. TaxID=2650926 RepID=UPI003783F327
MRKVTWRLVPFLMACYFIAYLDRVNVAFAGPTMMQSLGLTAAAFGGAAGIFFIAYFFFEIPSNLALNRFGARLWISRIMVTWGVISGAQAFVTGEVSLYVIRLLLGIAEAGFFPGIIFYMTLWFPAAYRARIVGLFMFAIPVSTVIGSPISGYILNLHGALGLEGWQWIFLIEALPAIAMAVAVLFYLIDKPTEAHWLTVEEKTWLQSRLDAEQRNREEHFKKDWFQSAFNMRVIALGLVYMAINIPQYGLSFFLPQIIKEFGVSDIEAGFITTLPYLVGGLGMIMWSMHSDRTGERVWHCVIPFIAMIIGLSCAAIVDDLLLKMAVLCVAAWGFFSILPVFWTLPTSFLSGAGAAAGIAAVNSIGNLGGYFGPQIFGLLKTATQEDSAGLVFLAMVAAAGGLLVWMLGHNPELEKPRKSSD